MTWIFYSSSAPHNLRTIDPQVRVLLACDRKDMTVLIKNLFTVHILIWQTQIRHQHYLWWRSEARLDTARRMILVPRHWVLWRRAALKIHSLSMPECALWTGNPPPKQQQNTPPNPSTLLQYNYCTIHDTSNYCHNTASHIINIISSIYYLGLTHHFGGTTFKSNYLYFYLHYLK